MKTKKLINKYKKSLFGNFPDGTPIYSYTISNKNGMALTVTNFGAAITSLEIPSKQRELLDVVLGFNDAESYIKSYTIAGAPYFGATVGRYAGRIKNGTFTLNGKTHQLTKNLNDTHTLHGGRNGFSSALWQASHDEKANTLHFTHTGTDGEEGFPGALKVKVTYTLNSKNELIISYTAEATEDTIINLTNHSYFNLDGYTADVRNQHLKVNASELLEVDNDNVPTGAFINVAEKDFDFNEFKNCPDTIDDSFITAGDITKPVATLKSEQSGIAMDAYTNQPSVHVYVGGSCGEIAGKEEAVYQNHSGICFETQNYPDAPNQPHFPSAVLKKGEVYQKQTIFKFKYL